MSTLANDPMNEERQACWMEHQIVQHVRNALRVTIDWKTSSVGLVRKLSSMRFTLQSFQRHLDRLLTLEETGGYMRVVRETKPNCQTRIDRLEKQHHSFRLHIRNLVPHLEELELQGVEQIEFENTCDEIRCLLNEIEEHDHEEIELLMECLSCDEGGEG